MIKARIIYYTWILMVCILVVGGYVVLMNILGAVSDAEHEEKWNNCVRTVSEDVKNKEVVLRVCEKMMDQ